MSVSKKFGIFLFAGIIGLGGLGLGERLSIPGVHSFVSTAEARSRAPPVTTSYDGKEFPIRFLI